MRPALVALALVAAVAAPGFAQEGGEGKKDPTTRHWPGGKVAFKREQGSEAELKQRIETLLRTIAKEARGEAAPAPAEDPEGLQPPAGEEAAAPPAKQTALEMLRSLAPDEAAVREAFGASGQRELGPKLLAAASRLFEGDGPAIARRLGIRPQHRVVDVYGATSEELAAMDLGTVAAREFAAGLRRVASHLRPQFRWYVVVLRPKADDAAEEQEELDPTDWDLPTPRDAEGTTRLQLLFRCKDRYVLLGRIWRLDQR